MKLNKLSTVKIALLSCALSVFSGCTDFLDRNHPTEVSDDQFWETMNECSAALDQCKLWVKGAWGGEELSLVFLEGATDNMYFYSNFDQRIVNLGNGSLVPPTDNNKPSGWEYYFSAWEYYYLRIRRCNRFLEHVDNAYFADERERTRMKAEARVWRAWYHIRLLNWYGRNDGIPIVEESLLPADIYKSRNSVTECLDFINRELDEVLSISDNDVFPFLWDEGRRDRMSKATTLALKMDINLQFHQYDIAKDAAKKLIDSGTFQLYYSSSDSDDPGKNYRDLFCYAGEQNKERIMFKSNGLDNIWFRNMSTILGGQGVSAPLKSLLDTYETIDGKTIQSLTAAEREQYEKDPLYKDRDPRLYATVLLPNDNTSISNYTFEPFNPNSSDYVGKSGASRSGYLVKKFIDEQDRASAGGSLDFMIYRYAEVLLDYVECLVETGDWQNADVEKYINMIRHRAGMPNMDKSVYNTQEKVRELYRRERRVELCFEGKRYDDIRRWNIGNEVMKGTIYGAWNPNDNTFVTIETRNCVFPKYDSWPLPQKEVTSNPNISQPTGW